VIISVQYVKHRRPWPAQRAAPFPMPSACSASVGPSVRPGGAAVL